jgi:hypothetical protein
VYFLTWPTKYLAWLGLKSQLKHHPVADPSDANAFSAEVAALDRGKRAAITGTKPASLGGLIAAYRAAPGFLELAVDTRKGYQRGFDACKPLDAMPVSSLDQAFILAFQERIYKKRGRWLANQVITVLSIVLGWGVPRGVALATRRPACPRLGAAKGLLWRTGHGQRRRSTSR